MTIEATEKEVIDAACKAIAASIPVGMGHLHYQKSDDIPDRKEVKKYLNANGLYIDYYHGRMVKFNITRISKNIWEFNDSIDPEYQSWARNFVGYLDLFTSIK